MAKPLTSARMWNGYLATPPKKYVNTTNSCGSAAFIRPIAIASSAATGRFMTAASSTSSIAFVTTTGGGYGSTIAHTQTHEQNGVRYADGVFSDITERKEAEKTTSQLVALVSSSSDAFIGNSADGVIRSWNPAAAKMFGYPEGE